MPSMYRFVLKFGAGDKLDETTSSIKACVGSTRQLGPDLYDALSQDMKPSTSDPFLAFRHAMLRLAYTGPERILTPSDIKRSFTKEAKQKVEAANRLIVEICQLMSSLPDTDGSLRLFRAHYESEVVMLTLEKRHKDMPPSATTIEGAAKVLCDLVKDKSGRVLSEKWDAHKPDHLVAASSTSGAKSVGTAVSLELYIFIILFQACFGNI